MLLYCEDCKIVFEDAGKGRCPVCGGKHKAAAQPDDICLLCEKEEIWSGVLSDALDDNGIAHFERNVLGAGIALKIGPMFEKVLFYVKYCDLDRAREIEHDLFSGEAGVADDAEDEEL